MCSKSLWSIPEAFLLDKDRFMKKLVDLLSNRLFVTIVAVLLQLAWIFALLWGVGAFSGHLMNLINVLSLILVLWIVNKKSNPSYKLAWSILILAVPVFGVIIYLLFGQSRVAGKMTQDSQTVMKKIANYFKEDKKTREALENTDLGASIQSGLYPGFCRISCSGEYYHKVLLCGRRHVHRYAGRYEKSRALYFPGIFYYPGRQDVGSDPGCFGRESKTGSGCPTYI